MPSSSLDAIVEAGLEDLSRCELEGGYRAICTMLLYRTAVVAGKPAPPRRQEIEAKAIAKQWLAGRTGIVSFPEACMAVSLDPDSARKKITVYADPASPQAISRRRRRPRNHYVFGRRASDGKQNPLNPRPASPPPGVGASVAHPAGHRGFSAGEGSRDRDRSLA